MDRYRQTNIETDTSILYACTVHQSHIQRTAKQQNKIEIKLCTNNESIHYNFIASRWIISIIIFFFSFNSNVSTCSAVIKCTLNIIVEHFTSHILTTWSNVFYTMRQFNLISVPLIWFQWFLYWRAVEWFSLTFCEQFFDVHKQNMIVGFMATLFNWSLDSNDWLYFMFLKF